ncbi:hypothetical protein AVEN_206008-1 [Araneus ventricosus]|uniref:Integrase zinc-binding domain-containing protein n=1 Tax=Araneus ventricosus TaxID=182803 RepID=A0A4Y2GXQ6_ARAVE|nr:hypothetical protein AVEN_206008-1 [Araneus ventricosus]
MTCLKHNAVLLVLVESENSDVDKFQFNFPLPARELCGSLTLWICHLTSKQRVPCLKIDQYTDEQSLADRPSWQEIAPESPATKRYWALWDSLQLKDDVLYRKWESDNGSSCRWQLIPPNSRIQEVLQESHDIGGHFGVMKTLSKTRERFY